MAPVVTGWSGLASAFIGGAAGLGRAGTVVAASAGAAAVPGPVNEQWRTRCEGRATAPKLERRGAMTAAR